MISKIIYEPNLLFQSYYRCADCNAKARLEKLIQHAPDCPQNSGGGKNGDK